MNDKEYINDSILANSIDDIDDTDDRSNDAPIKQCYLLADKYFIVIDDSIVQQLNFPKSSSEIYFQQFVGEDGCIILRPYKIGHPKDQKKIGEVGFRNDN